MNKDISDFENSKAKEYFETLVQRWKGLNYHEATVKLLIRFACSDDAKKRFGSIEASFQKLLQITEEYEDENAAFEAFYHSLELDESRFYYGER